ncbi:hypothetical protein [Bacillus cereus]|uniref:hypothetical protein n=1 Tax=Bacillus cereus TaxID=1396 RepID=UPI000279D162|nr:hypothetical protein [Bacillus cereus]EJR93371.1 hypothetical protein IKG_05487 [Bacillus cereus VD200]
MVFAVLVIVAPLSSVTAKINENSISTINGFSIKNMNIVKADVIQSLVPYIFVKNNQYVLNIPEELKGEYSKK